MTIRFRWNGEDVEAASGDSIAAALSAAGVLALGRRRGGRERGQFCGMGACMECLVIVDGSRSTRACMTEVADGMDVRAQSDAEAGPQFTGPPPAPGHAAFETDLAVIGAGPAGLNAAIVAANAAATVLVIDERAAAGGQYYKPRSSGWRGSRPSDAQHLRGAELRRRAEASGARILLGETVWYVRGSDDGTTFEIRSHGAAGQTRVLARALIIATGAFERPAMIPGWTRPGVMTIGAGQTLVRRYGVAPGANVLIAGNGPLGLQLAAEMRVAGARVAALVERASLRPGAALARAALAAPGLVRDGVGYRLRLLRDGVSVFGGWEVAEIVGGDVVEAAILRRVSDGARRTVAADVVCIGDGFAPQTELARLLGVTLDLDRSTGVANPRREPDGSTEIPGLWIAGDAGGIGGAQIAEAQGTIAGEGALSHLGRHVDQDAGAAARARQARIFQAALWSLYQAPTRALPPDPVIVCRCEIVTAGQIRAAIATGSNSPGALKRATRLGMGRCQGRYCSHAAVRLLAEAGQPVTAEDLFAPQLPARPIPVAALAIEKPEWAGHRESSPTARPGGLPDAPLAKTSADLVVIGAGVTGISAALFAARAGADVFCLDRGAVNGEASGGNAGSLHLQLLSWDFGAKAVASGSPQLRTLPLQQESIALWSALETELGADFELSVTGGLMVAEDESQTGFLEAKAAVEARMGIATEVIGPEAIRKILPGISPSVIAAAWCPGEGKINPLSATTALARAATEAGATIQEHVTVTGIQAYGDGYRILTSRGVVTARRVLIAAGGWTNAIARMIGASVPIRGAPLQMAVTETAPPLVPCLLAHADRHLTMKQTEAGAILIGGAWPATTGPDGRSLVLPDSIEGNLWVASHTVPAVGDLHVVRTWAAMNVDIDGAPLIGVMPGHRGVTFAATANGYTLGPLIGREAAAIALTGRSRQDIAAFSFDRFDTPTQRGIK